MGLNYVWLLAPLANGPQYPLGFALVASGVLVIARAMVQFGQAGTHIEPYKPTTAVVTDGVFPLAFLGMSEGATTQSKS